MTQHPLVFECRGVTQYVPTWCRLHYHHWFDVAIWPCAVS